MKDLLRYNLRIFNGQSLKSFKCEFFIEYISNNSDNFSHSEGGEYSSDTKTIDMSYKEECHTSSNKKAYYIKAYLNA